MNVRERAIEKIKHGLMLHVREWTRGNMGYVQLISDQKNWDDPAFNKFTIESPFLCPGSKALPVRRENDLDRLSEI